MTENAIILIERGQAIKQPFENVLYIAFFGKVTAVSGLSKNRSALYFCNTKRAVSIILDIELFFQGNSAAVFKLEN